MSSSRILTAAALMAAAVCTQAAPLRPSDLQHMSPRQAAQAARQLAIQQAARPIGVLDTTAPVLSALNVGTVLDPAKPLAPLLVEATLSDELSGLSSGYITFTSPKGAQNTTLYLPEGFGQAQMNAKGHLRAQAGMLPGTWTASDAWGWDVAGNYFHYDKNQLAALGGNVKFKVKNTAYDLTPPTLVSGEFSARSLSLSRAWPGTGQMPLLSAKLVTTDAGDLHVSGARDAYVTLCTATQSDCLYLSGSTEEVSGRTSIVSGMQLDASAVIGIYLLYQVELYDNAGNQTLLTSTAFGGETDFSTLFTTTQVELKR